MSDMNPYAVPMSTSTINLAHDNVGGLWQNGSILVMHRAAKLPAKCVKSNEPCEGSLPRKLSWHHPAVYLALLFNLLFYVIIAIAVSKRATIHIGLSDEWKAIRIRRILIAWGLFLLSIILLVGGIAASGTNDVGSIVAVSSIPLMLFAIFYGLLGARLVVAKKIDDQYIWLKGVHRDFLRDLPPWPYPS